MAWAFLRSENLFMRIQYELLKTTSKRTFKSYIWTSRQIKKSWKISPYSRNQLWNCRHFPHPTHKQLRHTDFSISKQIFFELVVTRIFHKQTPPLWNLISEVHSTGLILLEPSLDVTHSSIERFLPAILVFQTSETAAMLVFLTNPVKVELFSYV